VKTYLAIDGGNSKTDVLIGTSDGDVRGSARGAGTCYQNIGLPLAMTRLRDLVDSARSQAAFTGPFDRADVFLAGADLPSEVTLLTDAVVAEGWASTVFLENDTFALLRAGTDAADAVAVVCGAGINCVGRAASGQTARFPALGSLSGDWGGGSQLATEALWHAVRGEDGRGPFTELSEAVAHHFGLNSASDVGAAMHLGSVDEARLQELTPLLFAVAALGDPVASGVISHLATEIVALATVAARRLNLLDSTFVVVLGGGVLRAGHPQLVRGVTEGIHAVAPKAEVTVVAAPPVVGAALHALDALGADAGTHARLRSTPLG
jgi:N-acetylglucosamine kinase-like BadF-type ATPase